MSATRKYRLQFVSWAQDTANTAYVTALHALVKTAMLQKNSHCFSLLPPTHVNSAAGLAETLTSQCDLVVYAGHRFDRHIETAEGSLLTPTARWSAKGLDLATLKPASIKAFGLILDTCYGAHPDVCAALRPRIYQQAALLSCSSIARYSDGPLLVPVALGMLVTQQRGRPASPLSATVLQKQWAQAIQAISAFRESPESWAAVLL